MTEIDLKQLTETLNNMTVEIIKSAGEISEALKSISEILK